MSLAEIGTDEIVWRLSSAEIRTDAMFGKLYLAEVATDDIVCFLSLKALSAIGTLISSFA